MTPPIFIAAASLIVWTIGLVWAEVKGLRAKQFVFKPLASLSFCGLAVACGAFQSAYGHLIFLALAFSLLGDLLLLRKGTGNLFKTGMLAFLIAHLIYAFAFYYIAPSQTALTIAGVFGVVVGIANAIIYRSYVGSFLSILTGLYAALIGAMLVLAIYAGFKTEVLIIALAAQMFVASDIMVARERYVKHSPFNFALLTPLYFGAQGVFAVSILLIAGVALP